MYAKSLVVAAFMASTTIAQSSTSSGGSGTTISTSAIAAEVSATLKASWCTGQQSVCTKLCGTTPLTNTCDPTTLNYSCTCTNGTSPGLQYYANTIDSYTCQQAYADCIAAHPNDQLGQNGCTTNIRSHCGMLDAASYTPGAATTTAAAGGASSTAASATSAGAQTATSAAASATSTRASAANIAKELSFGIIGAGLFAAFGFML